MVERRLLKGRPESLLGTSEVFWFFPLSWLAMRRWRGTSANGDGWMYCMSVMEGVYVLGNIKKQKEGNKLQTPIKLLNYKIINVKALAVRYWLKWGVNITRQSSPTNEIWCLGFKSTWYCRDKGVSNRLNSSLNILKQSEILYVLGLKQVKFQFGTAPRSTY